MLLPRVDLSLALAGLDAADLGIVPERTRRPSADRGAEVRATIAWARARGFRAVQLDATVAGVRPRDLDRSGRRDLAATIRRADLTCSGLDLWIPPAHFNEPSQADRAIAAALGAIDLASELAALASGAIVSTGPGRVVGAVSLTLPKEVRADVVSILADRAASRSVRIADHAWPPRTEGSDPSDAVGLGIDPAEVLSAGGDPVAEAAKAGPRLVSARLSDLARAGVIGAGRVAAGSRSGRLDVLAYLVAVATGGCTRPVIADLRGVPDQAIAAEQIINAAQA